MPCVICRRRLAALPMPVCTECREVRRIATKKFAAENARCEICGEAGVHAHRIDARPPYRPAVRDEQPETD